MECEDVPDLSEPADTSIDHVPFSVINSFHHIKLPAVTWGKSIVSVGESEKGVLICEYDGTEDMNILKRIVVNNAQVKVSIYNKRRNLCRLKALFYSFKMC